MRMTLGKGGKERRRHQAWS